MVITYYGVSCFKVQVGETVFVFAPPSKKSNYKSPRFQANVVCVSHNHPDHDGYEAISGKGDGNTPMVINGPGEYETNGVYASGILSFHDNEEGAKHGLNTIYSLEIEGIRLCHLGDFGEKSLRPEVKEKIGEVDILFLPIGGETVLDPQTAAKASSQLVPKLIIPMHYGESARGRNPLNEFVKEFGGEDIKPADKLTIKKRDIAQKEETELVILAPCLS